MMSLTEQYPWTAAPIVVGAPMRLIALAPLAVEISAAGGFGFIGVGSNFDQLDSYLEEATNLIKNHPILQGYYEKSGILPVGFGFFNWASAEELEKVVIAVAKWKPAAIWQFGAHHGSDYAHLAQKVRQISGSKTQVWVQIGSVNHGLEVAKLTKPDVLVVQGTDAGGHGLEKGAGIISLLPELEDALRANGITTLPLIAAGGITDGRGAAAALTLGASGVCLGTRFLASEEASIADGYKKEVLRASDGGVNTARTSVYDQLRGTTQWSNEYNARGILNKSYYDHFAGMTLEENKKLYDEAMKKGDSGWGIEGRVTTYAGTGVGLVKSVMKAGDIVREIQQQASQRLKFTSSGYATGY